MITKIYERVSVNLISDGENKKVQPSFLKWHSKVYKLNKVNLHHTTHIGQVLFHIFSVSDGSHFFRLALNTMDLSWVLEEISDDSVN